MRQWLRGLVGGLVGGGAQSVMSAFGIAGASAMIPDMTPLDMRQIPIMFASGAIISTMMYLSKSPLPPESGDTELFEQAKNQPKDK